MPCRAGAGPDGARAQGAASCEPAQDPFACLVLRLPGDALTLDRHRAHQGDDRLAFDEGELVGG